MVALSPKMKTHRRGKVLNQQTQLRSYTNPRVVNAPLVIGVVVGGAASRANGFSPPLARQTIMKLKLIQGVVIQGYPGLQVGDVFDYAGNAAELVGSGYAVVAQEEQKQPEPVQVREPEVENRDPEIRQPKRTKSKFA